MGPILPYDSFHLNARVKPAWRIMVTIVFVGGFARAPRFCKEKTRVLFGLFFGCCAKRPPVRHPYDAPAMRRTQEG